MPILRDGVDPVPQYEVQGTPGTYEKAQGRDGGQNINVDGTDADGVSQLSGATGARGWLSGIFAKLSGILTAKIDQTTPGTTNGVQVNASALPSGAATSAKQDDLLTVVGSKEDAASATSTAGQSLISATKGILKQLQGTGAVGALPTAMSGPLESAAVVGATNKTSNFDGPPFDVENYSTVLIDLRGGFNAVIHFEGSVDPVGGTMGWSPIVATCLADGSASSTGDKVAMYRIDVAGIRSFRIRVTDYVSGIYTIYMRMSGAPSAPTVANQGLGAVDDAAVVDPALDASEVALLKGIIKQLQGDGTADKAAPVKLTGSNLDLRGLLANRPAANAVTVGATYWSLDRIGQTDEVTVSNGSTWLEV